MHAEALIKWLPGGVTWFAVLFASSLFVATFVGSVLVVGFLLVKLPPNYFDDNHPRDFWPHRHPTIRLAAKILKNLIGVIVLAMGVLLAVPGVPGQGTLTILIGIMMIDFPGKRRLERKIVSIPKVLATINHWRQRFGKPPLRIETDH